jgi:hypothetical protein
LVEVFLGDEPGWWYVVLTPQGRLQYHQEQLKLKTAIAQ